MVVVTLLAALAVLGLAFAAALLRAAAARGQLRPSAETVALDAATNFFDTLGIGSFAPTTAWLKLRGMVPDSFIPTTLNAGHGLPTIVQALPIMMGACAFLMPVSGLGFLRSRRIDLRVVIGITLGAIPAVLVAALVVKSLPLEAIRWGVVAVAFYAAAILLRAAWRPAPAVAAPGVAAG